MLVSGSVAKVPEKQVLGRHSPFLLKGFAPIFRGELSVLGRLLRGCMIRCCCIFLGITVGVTSPAYRLLFLLIKCYLFS